VCMSFISIAVGVALEIHAKFVSDRMVRKLTGVGDGRTEVEVKVEVVVQVAIAPRSRSPCRSRTHPRSMSHSSPRSVSLFLVATMMWIRRRAVLKRRHSM
jgi:hypothetical protein